MTVQDQYTTALSQAQQIWADAVESSTSTLQTVFAQQVSPFASVDPSAVIDEVFDFWTTTLEVQRGFAKELANAAVAVSTAVRESLESVQEAAREQVETVKGAVREQVESAQEAAREQVRSRYEGLTKDELQAELAARDLPKTGNVDELRERLVEDDQN